MDGDLKGLSRDQEGRLRLRLHLRDEPLQTVISEAVGFVNRVLLEEELDRCWCEGGSVCVHLVAGRAKSTRRRCRGVGRAVKAGRGPPAGGALTARSVRNPDNRCGVPPGGSWSRRSGYRRRDACAVVSSSPRVVGIKQARLGCLVISSPGPAGDGSEHGAIRRSQQCPIT